MDQSNKIHTCAQTDCKNKTTLQCPTCIKLFLPPVYFCSQECFKKLWTAHSQLHKACEKYVAPLFKYTGNLRPHYVTPTRHIPDHIVRPDYSKLQSAQDNSKINIYDEKQISHIRNAARIGREALDKAAKVIRPGITTDFIDKIVHDVIISRNAYPSPLHYRDFPKSCCTSVNEVICHGIPDCRPLQDGDIVNIDITVYYEGYHADLNETYLVGQVDKKSKELVKIAYESLMKAISIVKPNELIRNIGNVIEKYVHKNGYSVVRSYCGHGIGKLFHAPPNIPHYAKNKAIGILRPGMVFTIEPMINAGTWKDKTWPDNWTSVTEDGQRSAQFEHTLVVTQDGVEILTARNQDSLPFWWENNIYQ